MAFIALGKILADFPADTILCSITYILAQQAEKLGWGYDNQFFKQVFVASRIEIVGYFPGKINCFLLFYTYITLLGVPAQSPAIEAGWPGEACRLFPEVVNEHPPWKRFWHDYCPLRLSRSTQDYLQDKFNLFNKIKA